MEGTEKHKDRPGESNLKPVNRILNRYEGVHCQRYLESELLCTYYKPKYSPIQWRLFCCVHFAKMREKLSFLDENCDIVKQTDKQRPKSSVVRQKQGLLKQTKRLVDSTPDVKTAWTRTQNGFSSTLNGKTADDSKDEKLSEQSVSFLKAGGRSVTWYPTVFQKQSQSEIIRNNLRKQFVKNRNHTFISRPTKPRSAHRRQQSENQASTEDDPEIEIRRKKAISKFHLGILCVRVLIRWLNAIIEISNRKTSRTATEEQWYTLHYSQEAKELAFNKSLFSRERMCTRVPTWAIKLLRVPTEERTDHQCRQIHALLRGLKSFDKFTEKIQLYMCKSFRYHCVHAGRVILRKGHVGFNFYFIYSGSVFVNVEDLNIEGKRFEKTVTTLHRGDSFGELALLQDIRRTASITCRETCELLYVDKETFAKVCPRIFEKELEEKEKFLNRLPLFSPKWWTKEMLKSLCTEAQILEYKTNKVVATDSDDEEWLYICMEGKCQIIRRLCLEDGLSEQRRATSTRRASTPELSDEILDILGKINPTEKEDGESSEEESETDESNEGGKERLLESMALEYRGDGRRRKIIKSPDKEKDQQKQKKEMSLKEHTTLTSLMTQDLTNDGGKDYVYLNICLLQTEEVFDLYSILYPSRRPASSTVILVSTGAKLLRIKRKNFFSTLTYDALEHSKTFAKKNRYPTDKQLLESYKDKSKWEDYKYKLVQEVIAPCLKRQGKFSKVTLQQVSMMKKRHQRALKLLTTLKRNTAKNKKLEEESDEEEGEGRKSKAEEKQLANQAPPPPFRNPDSEQMKKDLLLERRSSTVSGRTIQRNVQRNKSDKALKIEGVPIVDEGSATGTFGVSGNRIKVE